MDRRDNSIKELNKEFGYWSMNGYISETQVLELIKKAQKLDQLPHMNSKILAGCLLLTYSGPLNFGSELADVVLSHLIEGKEGVNISKFKSSLIRYARALEEAS